MALVSATGGEYRETVVRDPLGEPVAAHWGWIAESRRAVIELAGMLRKGYQHLYGHGIDAVFSLAPGPISLVGALADAQRLLRQRAVDIARTSAVRSASEPRRPL